MTQDHETVARLEALAKKATAGPHSVQWLEMVLRAARKNSGPWDDVPENDGAALHDDDAPLAIALVDHALPLIRSLSARLAEAEAREAGLRAALEPFAALAGAISEGMTVSVLAADGSIINLSFEHFETAATILTAIRAAKEKTT